MVDFMMFFLMHEPMHLSTFGLGRTERQGLITDREIELGKLLLAHLRRAVTISKLLNVRTIEGARMAEALDPLRFMSQIAKLPLVSRQRMSLLPSPLKSPVSTIDHAAGSRNRQTAGPAFRS
jgi:hypothetical protein